MIENRAVPNINIFSNLSQKMPIDDFSKQGFGLSKLDAQKETSFKDILSGLISNVNNEIQKPDQLLQAQMMGNQDVEERLLQQKLWPHHRLCGCRAARTSQVRLLSRPEEIRHLQHHAIRARPQRHPQNLLRLGQAALSRWQLHPRGSP